MIKGRHGWSQNCPDFRHLHHQAQMAQMEQQLASLPPGQKEMIMRQMGPQLEMFRNMAAGNGIEVVSEVVAMRCNSDVPTNMEYAATLPGNMMNGCGASRGFESDTSQVPGSGSSGSSGSTGSSGSSSGNGSSGNTAELESDLVRMIQEYLTTLGYDPGPVNGILTRQTVIAITRFEAANGLPVTGEATPQLAGILQAKVAAL